MDGLDEQPKQQEHPTRVLLARALQRARGSLFWERLWPALATLATALGLFLAFSWAGLWVVLPPLARAIGLSLFVIVTAIATAPLAMVRLPSIIEGLRRLDRNSGKTHRPATAVADEIAANRHDPVAQALWRAHVERALLSARKLKAGWPSPRLAMRDPMALRALVIILVVASFFAAGGDRIKRVTAAFDWHGVVAPANFRIDAWVTPPNYTGRPPVMLAGLRPGETAQAVAAGLGAGRQPARDPLQRQCALRRGAQGRASRLRRRMRTRLCRRAARSTASSSRATARRRCRASAAAIWSGISTPIPDRAPTIALIKDPERQARGALRLDYKMEDDYGVVEAQAEFRAQGRGHAGRRGGASAVQGAGISAHTAAGAHAHGRGADHARSHRPPLGRRQGRGDAGRARRSRQRGHAASRPSSSCRSAFSSSRWRAP